MKLHDDLLEWCSERQEGSVSSFRQTHDWLCGRHRVSESDASLVLYSMQTLGHLEVNWSSHRWAVTPPVVTALDDSGGNALLVGARPRWLMRRLQTLAYDEDEQLREIAELVYLYDPVLQDQAPSAFFLTGRRDETLDALCDKLNIRFEHRVSLRLRETMPSVESYLVAGAGAAAPPGMEAQRFEPGAASKWWSTVEDDLPPGAYEYEAYGAPRYQYHDSRGRYEVEKSVAIYAEASRLGFQALYYEIAGRFMYVPARMPLPLLAARCAVLRTGVLPTFLRNGLDRHANLGPVNRYDNIPITDFKAICECLGQKIARI